MNNPPKSNSSFLIRLLCRWLGCTENSKPGTPDPIPTFPQPVPFVLAPSIFSALYSDQINPTQPGYPVLKKPLFPNSIVRNGFIIRPNYYILVERDYDKALYNLGEGETYLLKVDLPDIKDPTITIIKNRRCEVDPKDEKNRTLLLIQSAVSLEPLNRIPVDTCLPLLSPDGGGLVGEVHPGNSDSLGLGHGGDPSTESNPQGTGHSDCFGAGVIDFAGQSAIDFSQIVTSDRLTPTGTNSGKAHGEEYIDCVPDSPLVVILDTGIIYTHEPTASSKDSSCTTIKTGWDFVNQDAAPNDDQPYFHGSRIASIIRKQTPQSTIAPVKVSNELNVLTLYDALCGIEYARVIGAKIINASWSFPADGRNRFPLLRNAIERFGGWVVCAAGNPKQFYPDASHSDQALALGEENHYLYPACYSQDVNKDKVSLKVITVTTLINVLLPGEFLKDNTPNLIQKRQVWGNRSNEFVDVGVMANAPLPGTSDSRGFTTPGFPASNGTSFATPYIAGALAALFATGFVPASKQELLDKLAPGTDSANLGNDVQNGRYYPGVQPPVSA